MVNNILRLLPTRGLLSSIILGFCGVMSIFSSMRYCLGSPTAYGNLWAALAFMPLGLFFDFMDGKVARWRKKSSSMGQELDSLADLVIIPFFFPYTGFEFTGRFLQFLLRFLSVFPPQQQLSQLV